MKENSTVFNAQRLLWESKAFANKIIINSPTQVRLSLFKDDPTIGYYKADHIVTI